MPRRPPVSGKHRKLPRMWELAFGHWPQPHFFQKISPVHSHPEEWASPWGVSKQEKVFCKCFSCLPLLLQGAAAGILKHPRTHGEGRSGEVGALPLVSGSSSVIQAPAPDLMPQILLGVSQPNRTSRAHCAESRDRGRGCSGRHYEIDVRQARLLRPPCGQAQLQR